MIYTEPMRKLHAAQMKVAIKLYGVDTVVYEKLQTTQDEVYGSYGGAEPVAEVVAGSSLDIYGEYASVPVVQQDDGIVELSSFEEAETTLIDVSSSYSQPRDLRVYLQSWQWRVVNDSHAGFYEDSGYVWCNYDTMLKSGDVLELKREDGDVFRVRVISPEEFGSDEKLLIRFKITNLGG